MAALRSLLLVHTFNELVSRTRSSPFFNPTASISPSPLKLRQRAAWPTHTLLSSFCREEEVGEVVGGEGRVGMGRFKFYIQSSNISLSLSTLSPTIPIKINF